MPISRAPRASIGFTVEPGGYCPAVARLNSGFLSLLIYRNQIVRVQG